MNGRKRVFILFFHGNIAGGIFRGIFRRRSFGGRADATNDNNSGTDENDSTDGDASDATSAANGSGSELLVVARRGSSVGGSSLNNSGVADDGVGGGEGHTGRSLRVGPDVGVGKSGDDDGFGGVLSGGEDDTDGAAVVGVAVDDDIGGNETSSTSNVLDDCGLDVSFALCVGTATNGVDTRNEGDVVDLNPPRADTAGQVGGYVTRSKGSGGVDEAVIACSGGDSIGSTGAVTINEGQHGSATGDVGALTETVRERERSDR